MHKYKYTVNGTLCLQNAYAENDQKPKKYSVSLNAPEAK